MVGESDAGTSDDLLEPLRHLRSRGMNSASRIHPALLRALGVPSDTPPGEARDLVRRSLLAHSDRLDHTHRIAFLESAGFRRDAPVATGDRVSAAAGALKTSKRTIYRLIEQAIDQIAALVFSRSQRCLLQDIDYVFLRARVRVDLTGNYPAIVTERTLSARSDGIDHLDERLFFPKLAGEHLNLIALEGCTLEDNNFVDRGIWSIRLRLPRALAMGEQHTFAVSVRLPDHESLDPVIGFLPRTTSFDATVEFRFGDRLPAMLEKFTAPPPIPGIVPAGDTERVTPEGRRHTFVLPQMRPGLCYGVRWFWPAEPEPAVPVS